MATHIPIPLGSKFGKLQVVSAPFRNPLYRDTWTYLCKCGLCGNVNPHAGYKLKRIRSCACVVATHGASYDRGTDEYRLYRIYHDMRSRCLNHNCPKWEDYGGRGITICDEWLADVQTFISWGLTNGYKRGLTIDRKDNDGPYCPDNCRFITHQEQSWNKRQSVRVTIGGATKTLMQWYHDLGAVVHQTTVRTRLHAGWDPLAAFMTPSRSSRKRKRKQPACNREKSLINATAKLTPELVVELRRRKAAGESYRALAAETGLTRLSIFNAVIGKSWAWVK